MARKAKPWRQEIEEMGVTVRVFERVKGGTLYAEVLPPAQPRKRRQPGEVVTEKAKDPRIGKRPRRTLGTADKALALETARAIARQEASERVNGRPDAPLTYGELKALYLQHRGPLLKPKRLHFVKRTLELFTKHLGPDFPMDDFGPDQAESFRLARESGKLRSDDHRASKEGVRDGTVRNELQCLSAVCNWAVTFKRGGKRLVSHNPVRDVRMPKEENTKRPVMTRDRFDKLLEVAPKVDPSGQFRLMLFFAWHTGRRINAICHLKASDVLFGADQVRRGLARIGWDEAYADEWENAVIFRGAFDKKGYDWAAFMPAPLMAEIRAYLSRAGVVGDAWLFPSLRTTGKPTLKTAADWWLNRAERVAGLAHQARGGWHAMRRAWATQRKGHALPDVMLAGGWKDPKALQKVYQAADPKSVRAVMEAV